MPRREIYENNTYLHIYSRGVHKDKIFFDQDDKERFMYILHAFNNSNVVTRWDVINRTQLTTNKIVELCAFVLMDNHFHLLIQVMNDSNLISTYLGNLLKSHSMYVNTKYDLSGVLFESRFKAVEIKTDLQLHHTLDYIHNNPIKLINKNYSSKSVFHEQLSLTASEIEYATNYPYSSKKAYLIKNNSTLNWPIITKFIK